MSEEILMQWGIPLLTLIGGWVARHFHLGMPVPIPGPGPSPIPAPAPVLSPLEQRMQKLEALLAAFLAGFKLPPTPPAN